MAKCSCCSENKNIVYWDYCHPKSIKICWACLGVLGWETEMRAVRPKLLNCVACRQKFIPKQQNQNKCGVCWQKLLGYEPKEEIKLPEIKTAFDIQGGIYNYGN